MGKKKIRRINGMAKRIIMQTVSDDHLSYKKAYKNADEIWMEMQQRYGTPSDVVRIEKLIQLFNQSKNNDTVTKYIARKRNLFSELNFAPPKHDDGSIALSHREILVSAIISGDLLLKRMLKVRTPWKSNGH